MYCEKCVYYHVYAWWVTVDKQSHHSNYVNLVHGADKIEKCYIILYKKAIV